MDDKLLELLQHSNDTFTRIADLIERAVGEQDVEIEVPPPSCPHCQHINPTIIVAENETQGALGSYVLVATCLHCKKTFYAVPVFWNGFRKSEEAKVFAESKLQGVNNGTARNS